MPPLMFAELDDANYAGMIQVGDCLDFTLEASDILFVGHRASQDHFYSYQAIQFGFCRAL